MNLSFAQPWLLLLLAAPIWLLWRRNTAAGQVARLPIADSDTIATRPSLRTRMAGVCGVLPILLAGTGILLLAGPRKAVTLPAERESRNVVFLLDCSGSMGSPFGPATRYDAAMAQIHQFTQRGRGDSFALSAFGEELIRWVPLTRDLSPIRLALPFLRPATLSSAFTAGTKAGHAIDRECEQLRQTPAGDRMIVLITDGITADVNSGNSAQLAARVRAAGVKLFAVIIGGDAVPTEIARAATLTGGEAFAATDPAAMPAVFKAIDAMTPATFRPVQPGYADFSYPVLIAAAVFAAGYVVLTLGGMRALPW